MEDFKLLSHLEYIKRGKKIMEQIDKIHFVNIESEEQTRFFI